MEEKDSLYCDKPAYQLGTACPNGHMIINISPKVISISLLLKQLYKCSVYVEKMGEVRVRSGEGGGEVREDARVMGRRYTYSPVAFSHRMASLSFNSNSLTSSVYTLPPSVPM